MAFRIDRLNDVFRKPKGGTQNEEIEYETLNYHNAVVHIHYDRENPPARPDPSTGTWARVICVSDTHNTTFDVPEGDIFLHAGDMTNWGQYKQLESMVSWMKSLPHPHKIVIAGNHDLTLDTAWWAENRESWNLDSTKDLEQHRLLFEPNEEGSITYLEYQSCEIEVFGHKLKIFGSPGSPEFCNWAFMYDRGDEAKEMALKIPEDSDIVITHGPPQGILDRTRHGEPVGCAELTERIKAIKPRLHVFGHIHESRGALVHEYGPEDASERKTTVYANAACHPMPRGKYPMHGAHDRTRWYMLPIIVDLKLA